MKKIHEKDCAYQDKKESLQTPRQNDNPKNNFPSMAGYKLHRDRQGKNFTKIVASILPGICFTSHL